MKIQNLKIKFIAVLIALSLSMSSCGNKDMSEIRRHIKDVIIATQGVTNALINLLPKDDPRLKKLIAFEGALERFDKAFVLAPKDPKLLILFADLVTAFREAMLPLVPMGGTIAILIIAADTALRFIANRLAVQITKYKIAIETLADNKIKTEVRACEIVLIDFLASPPACDIK